MPAKKVLPVKKKEKKVKLLDRLPKPRPSGWVKIVAALCVLALLPFLYSYVTRTRARLLKIDQVAIHYLTPKGYKLAYRDAGCLSYLNRMQKADLANAQDREEAAFSQGVKEGCFIQLPGAADPSAASVDLVMSNTVALSDETELKHLVALGDHLVDSDDCAYYKKRSSAIETDAQKNDAAKVKSLKQLFDTARTFRCLK